MIDFIKTPQVIAAIIAAITSIITLGLTLLTKNSIEKNLLIFRLNSEYKFEQRKKIKNCGALPDNFTVKAVALNKDSEPRVLKINQDMILTLCETSSSSCSESNTYFSNANGTDSNCIIYE